VDYFAVIPTANLKQESGKTLAAVAESMRARFPNTDGIRVSTPGVLIPFGDEGAEAVEIVPVDQTGLTKLGFRQFDIPDGSGGWKFSAPESHKAYVDRIDTRLGGKVKQLIRLLKAWKFYRKAPIKSFYLELRVAAYAETEQAIIYDIDIKNVMTAMWNDQLAEIYDPRFPDDGFLISATNGPSSKAEALSKLASATKWSQQAVLDNAENRSGAAISRWNLVYDDAFPSFRL
jgi:hypothetical protein